MIPGSLFSWFNQPRNYSWLWKLSDHSQLPTIEPQNGSFVQSNTYIGYHDVFFCLWSMLGILHERVRNFSLLVNTKIYQFSLNFWFTVEVGTTYLTACAGREFKASLSECPSIAVMKMRSLTLFASTDAASIGAAGDSLADCINVSQCKRIIHSK